MINNSNQTKVGVVGVVAIVVAAFALGGCGGAKARQARYAKRGEAYLAQGQYEKARVELRNALQIAPNDADLRYYNGVVAEKLGDIRQAVGFYYAAVDANKGHVAARASLGRLLVFAGVPDRALDEVAPGLASHPNSVELLTVHAAALRQKGKLDTALAEARHAVDLDPKNEDAIATLAGIETATGQPDAARKLIETAVEQMPKAFQLRRVLAQVYLDRKDFPGAERVFLGLIGLQPEQRTYRVQLAQMYAQANRLDDAERTLRKAVADLPADEDVKRSLVEFLWSRRGRDVAEAQIKAMIAAAPADGELRFMLGTLYEMSGGGPKAEAEYRNLIDKQGRNALGLRARDRLAALYVARNDSPGAQKLINEVLDQNPGDNDALGLRAYEELLQGNAEAAISDLRRVLRDQPNSARLLGTLARAYIAAGEPDLAEDAALRAVESDPSDVTGRMGLAQVYIARAKFDQGRNVLRELNKQRPDDAPVLDLLFRSNLALGDASGAQFAANELIRLRPQWGLGQLYLGLLAQGAGRTEEALADYRRSFELQPHGVEALNGIARLLQREKRFDEATQFLDEVIQRDANAAVAPSLKGEVLLAQGGHLEQAEAAFRLALARAPKWWNPYRGLAYTELARNKPEVATQVLRDAAAHAQLSEQERFELAGLLTGVGQHELAMEQYEADLKVHPKSQVAAAGLAMLLVSYRTDTASYNRAVSLVRPLAASSDWRLLDAFGWVQFKNDDLTAALPALEKAVSTAQEKAAAQRLEMAELRFHLAMAELKAGQSDTAEKNLAQAVADNDRFFGHDEAKAVLAQLRNRKS